MSRTGRSERNIGGGYTYYDSKGHKETDAARLD